MLAFQDRKHVMKFKRLEQLVLAVLLSVVTPPASAQTKPAVELEAAVKKEQVDGDLAAAMAIYRKIAADTAAPRDVRAKALLRLGGCYEKFGRQAQNIYQQILREFGDQPAAVQARVRLAALRERHPAALSTMTERQIEIPGGSFEPQATDGRRMVYRDDAAGEIVYSDVATKSRRVIFKAKPDDLPDWMPSRDFSMVALQFEKKPNRPAFVALVQIDGKGYRELLRDDEQGNVIGADGSMANWSWDNRFLLVTSQERGKRAPRLLVVSTTPSTIGGEPREAATLESDLFDQCAFSPDGRFIACSLYQGAQVFVWPAQGGERRLIQGKAGYLRLLDWTADGRYLEICSGRTGKPALYLFPVKDGQTAGEPILVRSAVYESGVTTKAGALIYKMAKPGGLWTMHLASLDTDGKPGTWQKLERPGENTTNPWPRWSPDSNEIVYIARDVGGEFGNAVVRVRNLSTGGDREIYRSPGHVVCAWAVQQPKIFCSRYIDESAELLSIAPDSGQIERVGRFPSAALVLLDRPSRDDKALYLFRTGKEKASIARWEIAAGRETILDESSTAGDFDVSVSPDERWLMRKNPGRGQIEVRPMSGGEWKTIASSTNNQYAITPDGKWLFYHGADSAGNHGLYRVPIAGGQPEHRGAFPTKAKGGTIEISPDGRQVVTASYDYDHSFELWALDNFVPAARAR